MKKFLIGVSIATLLLVGGCKMISQAHAEWAPAAMNTVIDQTNVLVNEGCSGTIIDKSGLILTAAHCVTEQYRYVEKEDIADDGTVTKRKVRESVPGSISRLEFQNASEVSRVTYMVNLVKSDTQLDLALLKTQSPVVFPGRAKIACKEPIRGETAIVVGNPFGTLFSNVTKGVVSSTNRTYRMLGIPEQGDHQLLQVSSGIIGGNSGGAVYNDNGELIGVPVRASRINEIIGFAVPLGDIRSFLGNRIEPCNG